MRALESWRLIAHRVPRAPRDWLALPRSERGRRQIRQMFRWLLWPILRPAAWLYRRTVLRRRTLVAVTGSLGKTTTAEAIAAALGVPPPRGSSFRTGLALGLLKATPRGAPLVFEVAISRPHQMAPYAGLLRPDIAIVTAIADEHRSAFGSIDRTAAEKGLLVAGLRPGGLAVLNGDDPRVLALATLRPPGARMVTVGLAPANDYRAANLRLDWPHGTQFTLHGPGFEVGARVQLLGAHQVRAVVIAAAVARELGESIAAIVQRLAAFAPIAGRLSRTALPSGAWILRDDLKSSLATVEAALDVFEQIPARRRIIVLGDVSEHEESKNSLYRSLGKRLGRSTHRILFIGQKFDRLRTGAKSAGLDPARVTRHASVEEIATVLRRELEAGDVVLIKGGRRGAPLHGVARQLTGEEVPRWY